MNYLPANEITDFYSIRRLAEKGEVRSRVTTSQDLLRIFMSLRNKKSKRCTAPVGRQKYL